MSVPGQKDVSDVLTADMEVPLLINPWRTTRNGREEQRIRVSERSGRKPPTELLPVRVERATLNIG